VFSSVDCKCNWRLWKHPVVYVTVLAGIHAADVQSSVLSPSPMHVTASYIDQQLRQWHFVTCLPMCQRRCFKSLVSRTGVLYTRSCISSQIRYSQPSLGPDWLAATDLESGEIKSGASCCSCLDCFTSTQWRHNCVISDAAIFKNKKEKVKGQGKLHKHVIFESVLMLHTKNYQNTSVRFFKTLGG